MAETTKKAAKKTAKKAPAKKAAKKPVKKVDAFEALREAVDAARKAGLVVKAVATENTPEEGRTVRF